MIVEEATAEQGGDFGFMREWAGVFPTREALEAKIGERLAWSVVPSFRQTSEGWTLAFSPDALADAQEGLNGDFWGDWSATDCPILLVQGSQSRAVDGAVLKKMAAERANTKLATFEAGHVVHHDVPTAFASAARSFLTNA